VENRDDKLFQWTRDQIEHEDKLLNHRMTWLLSLQGVSFGAYGLSLTANPKAVATISNFNNVRPGLALLGLLGSLLLLIGITAAAGSMQVLVTDWKQGRSKDVQKSYPQIIGSDFLGIWGGLIPAYALPLVCTAVWSFLQWDNQFVRGMAFGSLFLALLCLTWLGTFRLRAAKRDG
jgi:hypothetical protein